MRGIKWAASLGFDIGAGKKILSGKYDNCFQQAKYSVPNKDRVSEKKSKKIFVKFSNEVLLKTKNEILKLPLKTENNSFKQCFYVKLNRNYAGHYQSQRNSKLNINLKKL